jgi:hypothetical protein
MNVRHVYDYEFEQTWPRSFGGGSHHAVTYEPDGRVFGKPGARIRVRLKRNPIGFHVPRATP